jgi:hypothetical protein
MSKRFHAAVCTAAALLPILTGCGKRIHYELPETPIEFHTGTFVNPVDPDDTYQSIEYNGRIYIAYGTIKKSIHGDDVGTCLGYIVQDGAAMKDERIFLLTGDSAANYLVRCDIGGIMAQPIFFRALDTQGKGIGTPGYIESLDYPYWK